MPQSKELTVKTARQDMKKRFRPRYQQIIQLALEAHVDMVAMGVRGRGALDLAVFGSTTYRVLQLGPCPGFSCPRLKDWVNFFRLW